MINVKYTILFLFIGLFFISSCEDASLVDPNRTFKYKDPLEIIAPIDSDSIKFKIFEFTGETETYNWTDLVYVCSEKKIRIDTAMSAIWMELDIQRIIEGTDFPKRKDWVNSIKLRVDSLNFFDDEFLIGEFRQTGKWISLLVKYDKKAESRVFSGKDIISIFRINSIDRINHVLSGRIKTSFFEDSELQTSELILDFDIYY